MSILSLKYFFYVQAIQNISASTKNQSWARTIFLASRQRQRDNVIEPHEPEKIQKIFWSRCLDGEATTKIVKLQ